MSAISLVAGAALNLGLALAALARRALTPWGAVAGVAVGAGIYLAGGAPLWSLLALFFVSSTVLSRFRHTDKEAAEDLTGKGGRRDAVQVLANGGPALLMSLAWLISGEPAFLLGCATALAAANADTWASELGLLSRRAPVSIVGLRPVQRGVSGGVTPLGFAASLAGASLMGVALALIGRTLAPLPASPAPFGLLVAAGGFLGSVVDSLLGATLQARYLAAVTGRHTERARDPSGRPNTHAGGLRILTNDAVNFLSGLAASGTVALVAALAL